MTKTLLTYARIAVLSGLPALAGCMAPESAVDALPSNANERTTALAETRDNLVEMDRATAHANVTMASTTTTAAPMSATAENARVAAPVVAAAPDLIVGLGFAQIANQPGATTNQKRLLALRAARMEAMRDLTEQVHGLHLNATTTVGQMVVTSDQLTGVVQGTIRGARTVSITPKGTDGYEVKLALDADTVAYIVRAFRGQI